MASIFAHLIDCLQKRWSESQQNDEVVKAVNAVTKATAEAGFTTAASTCAATEDEKRPEFTFQ